MLASHKSECPSLSICLRCRDGRETQPADLQARGGRRLARAVMEAFGGSAAEHLGVLLRGVNCMSQCKRPCVIALSGQGRFTYLFGDLDPRLHRDDILAVSVAYAQTKTGFLHRADRPEVMRAGILGRVPPLDFGGDIVEPLLPHTTQPVQEIVR